MDATPLGRDARVIGLVAFGHGTSHFFHLMLPPLFPWLMADFALNFTQAGFLMSVFFVLSGVGQATAGFFVDRLGAWRVLCAGIGFLAASGLALAAAPAYAGLVAAAALAGLGNSIFHPADFTLLNRKVSQPRLGHAFSMHGIAGNLGWAAGAGLMAAVAGLAGWRWAGLAASAVGFAALAAMVLGKRLLHDAPAQAPHPKAGTAASSFHFLGSTLVWMCFGFFFLTTVAFGALQNFAPSLFSHAYALTVIEATACLTAYLLGSAGGILTGGFLATRSDRHDRRIAGALAVAFLVALLLATGAPPAWGVAPLMAAMGFGVGVAGPSRDLMVRRAAVMRAGDTAFGRIYGFVYSGFDVGLALAPVIFGRLMDDGQFSGVLYGIAGLQALAVFTALAVGGEARRASAQTA